MLTVVAAIIPKWGLAPSLYRVKIEHGQHEHLNTVNSERKVRVRAKKKEKTEKAVESDVNLACFLISHARMDE